jgi:hypothetical protein
VHILAMGSSASKTARKLPKYTLTQPRNPPKWAGARTPHPEPAIPEGMEGRPGYQAPSSGAQGRAATRADHGMADQGAAPVTGRARAGFSGEKDDGMSTASGPLVLLRVGRDEVG